MTMLEAKDVSISVKLGTKYVYVSLDKLTENERQTLFECLKNGDFERAGQFMNQNEKTHELETDRTKAYPSPERYYTPQHVEQTSLGQTETFGSEPDIETVYEKAEEGCEKSLRLIAEWSRQGDMKATMFLTKIASESKPTQPRKRVIIL